MDKLLDILIKIKDLIVKGVISLVNAIKGHFKDDPEDDINVK